MADLRFRFEWRDPGLVRGQELRATWARLQIRVGEDIVTRVEDSVSRGTHEAVHGPLYPPAEWIATNWWPLLHEVRSPGRDGEVAFLRGHSLAAAGEGFALPRLSILPEGESIRLEWRPARLPAAHVSFLAGGEASVSRASLEEELRALVSGVVRRIRDQSVADTLLEEAWQALESADAEERAFCRAAARLGWDPFAISGVQRDSLLAAAAGLPEEILDEFLTAVGVDSLARDACVVQAFLDSAQDRGGDLDGILELRRRVSDLGTACADAEVPWRRGYALARAVRALLPAEDRVIGSIDGFGQLLGLDAEEWSSAIRFDPPPPRATDAILATNRAGSPLFSLRARRPPARLFHLCRTLGDYLGRPHDRAALATTTYSERQKANRAFAAELLAPASLLARRIGGAATLNYEDLQDIAQEYGVSEYVIGHQIQNHAICKIIDWSFPSGGF